MGKLEDNTAATGEVMVKEEVASAEQAIPRRQSAYERWKLCFMNNLPRTIFKGKKVEAEGNTPVQIALVDVHTNEIVTDCYLSSMEIEVLVLDGSFGDDGQEDWSADEFDSSVLKVANRAPLLIGSVRVQLNNGVVPLEAFFTFTDFIDQTQRSQFKLGARADKGELPIGVIVREAISSAFIVKDQPGEAAYQKHEYPNLLDEVWRLRKIEKGSACHMRLAKAGVYTVQGFLRMLAKDPLSLRRELGGRRISDRTWESIVEHAKKCIIDNHNVYSYRRFGQQIELHFNCILELKGAVFEDRKYVPRENFTVSQMNRVEDMKRLALRDSLNMIRVQEPPTIAPDIPILVHPIRSFSPIQWGITRGSSSNSFVDSNGVSGADTVSTVMDTDDKKCIRLISTCKSASSVEDRSKGVLGHLLHAQRGSAFIYTDHKKGCASACSF